MNIVQEKIDSLNALLKVQLTPSDYKPQVDDALRKYSKKVTMKGFRPGMVPEGLVRKLYGKSVLFEEVNKIVGASIDKYISENNLQLLGNPLPKADNGEDINWEQPADFEFSFEMGLAPEVNVSLPPAHTFTTYDIQVDDKAVNDEVDKIIRRYGDYVNPEMSDAESSIYGNFQELDANGELAVEGWSHQSFLLFDKIKDSDVRQRFIGRVVGDVVDFNPIDAMKSHEEVKYLLGLKEEDPDAYNKMFRCTIERINKVVPAALNEDLFNRIYGDGVVTDEAGFREKIKAEIAEGYRYESEHAIKHELEDVMLNESNMALPDEFLKRWLKQTNEKITDEQLQNEYNSYARDLKWRLIENKIFRDQNMEINKEEIENYARTFILDQYVRYGQAHLLTEEKVGELTARYLQNEESVQRVVESLSSRKVFEYLNQILSKNVKPVSHDEFVDIMSKHAHQHH
ncbi:trigger factor [soil metagenome]